ncbi:efflux RND transporter periplasmic adaptor subunit [Aliiglaciecola sp. LCG003]|uniref:efflux RND transporter periplasmic adaptor subunit n=1 Tax=Aliiglaciecola sp. LCG003 TaxID=3053655 RepID=UPI002573BC7E|nr:efflux RND transporter periplasmic adaptor subunit [Aliiglaciecola sp. LCG003]WJG10316.1 efflux RND transporter periplasmic adaptor subunit [Aliiglaciecola sp. LCG003]
MKILNPTYIMLVALMGLTLNSKSYAQSRPDSGPTKVITEPLKFESLETTVEAVGTAEALKSVNVYPATADKVIETNFTPGHWVEKGQVLLKLDSRRQTAALKRSQIMLKDAKRNLLRLQQSSDGGAVAQSALDAAKISQELAEVSVIDAQTDLEDRVLIAPFSGYVGLSDIEVGDRITTQTMVTTLDDRSRLFVNFSAPESSLAAVTTNSRVVLQPWSDRNIKLDAKVSQVDSRLDIENRTIRVRAELDNKQDVFRPGMSFRVNLIMQGQEYAAIPESGLSWGPSGAYVWKVIGNKATKVPVNIKQRLRGRVLVEGDLLPADTIIVEGIQRLRPGQEIQAQPNKSD